MSLAQIFNQITAGGVVSVIVIVLSLVEITPIKLSPLKWIGHRVNGELEHKIDDTNKRVDVINEKLNNHMVESHRTNILDFADSILHGKVYTHDKWRQMLKVCAAYEQMIHTEGLINGDATEAINYIREQYRECLSNNVFVEFIK